MSDHEHCCEHENLRYCKVCKVIYCVDCGIKWKVWGKSYGTYPYEYTTTTGDFTPHYTHERTP